MDQNSFNDLLRVQRMMASKIMDETAMDAKIKLLDLLREIPTGKNKNIQIEQIIIVAEEEGFSENDVRSMLDELERDGMVKQTSNSTVILT